MIDCDLSTGVCPRCLCAGEPHWHRNCNGKTRSPCRYLGPEIRRDLCPTCGDGNQTKIKVFACTVFGEATIGKKLEGISCCHGCDSWEAKLVEDINALAPFMDSDGDE